MSKICSDSRELSRIHGGFPLPALCRSITCQGVDIPYIRPSGLNVVRAVLGSPGPRRRQLKDFQARIKPNFHVATEAFRAYGHTGVSVINFFNCANTNRLVRYGKYAEVCPSKFLPPWVRQMECVKRYGRLERCYQGRCITRTKTSKQMQAKLHVYTSVYMP